MTEQTRPLVRRPGADTLLRWSLDGTQIAFVSQNGEGTWLAPSSLCTISPVDSVMRNVTEDMPENINTDADSYFWSFDNQTIFFTARLGVTRQLFNVDCDTKSIKRVTNGNCVHDRFSASNDGNTMAFVIDQPTRPGEIYTSGIDHCEPKKLLPLNSHLSDLTLGMASTIQWASKDGTQIEGILIKPSNHKTGETLPMVTSLHGVPAGSFLLGFSPEVRLLPQVDYCPVQVLVSRGIALFCPNPRGSDGYGHDFRQAVKQGWGRRIWKMSCRESTISLTKVLPIRIGLGSLDTATARSSHSAD